MRLYLTEAKLPELQGMTNSERRDVLRRASVMLASKTRWPGRVPASLSSAAGVVGALGSARMTLLLQGHLPGIDFSLLAPLCCMCCVGLCGALGGFIGATYLLHRLRPYIRDLNHEPQVA